MRTARSERLSTFAREARALAQALDPAVTIARRAEALVRLPARVRDEQVQSFAEVMAYPVFDLPMYKPLAGLSAELLIPNVNLIEKQQHHPARDQPTLHRSLHGRAQSRVRARAAVARISDRPARKLLPAVLGRLELLRRTRSWIPRRCASGCVTSRRFTNGRRTRSSAIMIHAGRREAQEDLVLVIRGELLKRYPECRHLCPEGRLGADRWHGRSVEGTRSGRARTPGKRPIRRARNFERRFIWRRSSPISTSWASISPSTKRAAATERTRATRPAGSSSSRSGRASRASGSTRRDQDEIVVWNDLAWDRVPMAGGNVAPLPPPGIQIPASVPAGEEEKEDQRREDVQVRWNDDVSAAELAYILFQAPAMVAVHAAEMLPRKVPA